VSADASCVEEALLAAVEAAASQCLAAGLCGAGASGEAARGGACWLGCVSEQQAVEAGEKALAFTFEAGTCAL
jgi:hypothetical protein